MPELRRAANEDDRATSDTGSNAYEQELLDILPKVRGARGSYRVVEQGGEKSCLKKG